MIPRFDRAGAVRFASTSEDQILRSNCEMNLTQDLKSGEWQDFESDCIGIGVSVLLVPIYKKH